MVFYSALRTPPSHFRNAERVGFYASPCATCTSRGVAKSAALPGAGKPFAGWFSIPPFESLHLIAKTRAPAWVLLFLAERVGFEPTLPLRGKHDFQSCAFDQLSHLSTARFFRRNVYNTRMRSNLQAFFYSSCFVFSSVIPLLKRAAYDRLNDTLHPHRYRLSLHLPRCIEAFSQLRLPFDTTQMARVLRNAFESSTVWDDPATRG